MRGLGNKSSVRESGKSCYSDTLSKLIASPKFKKSSKVSYVKKVKPKSVTTIASSLSKRRSANSLSKVAKKIDTSKKVASGKGLHKAHGAEPSDKLSLLKLQNEKPSQDVCNEKGENADGETKSRKRRRKKTSKKNKVDVDETARLQRRTRYLLIKIKLEKNLIDAYSGEGWKGQSREKIKPEKELQRAENQILKCKLGIRDAIRHLHSLSSVGSIADSVIDPDGSVYHEHIFCAKCKLNEAFPDNDIVLCDGTCNAAFHQQCLDPPLATENIPRGDQGWFCKFCECKMEILEVVNAHLGTCFSMDSTWQDVFKEEASFPDGGNLLLNPDGEWPSDESDDDDYNPDSNLNSCSISREGSDDDGSDDGLSTDGSIGSHESTDEDIVSGRRQRSSVDYKKLYDEMFGKDGLVIEQVSDDEDWGPRKKKQREKESDAATTLMTLYESERIPDDVPAEVKKKPSSDMKVRRSCFRIPHTAVEKLRQVFSENELPSKAVKDNISKELGLDPEKVSKWFKNTRYLALKTRKAEGTPNIQTSTSAINKESRYENVTGMSGDLMVSDSEDTSANTVVHSPRNKKLFRRKHPKSISSPLNKIQPKGSSCLSPAKSNKDGIDLSDDVSLKKLLEGRTKEKRASIIAGGGDEFRVAEPEMEGLSKVDDRRANINPGGAGGAGEYQVAEVEVEVDRLSTINKLQASIIDGGGSKSRVAELEMERLCALKGRLEHMRQRLLKFQVAKAKKSKKSQLQEQSVIYVPVAVLKEKDVDEESVGVKKVAHGRGMGSKRSRATKVHTLSEWRRRDRINEKMRALQELVPNCNKVDNASMLDDAIEYLKTLQIQVLVQMMSMGVGLYIPQMMLPPRMQHMQTPCMAHFSCMGVGRGMRLGMGFGMGMAYMNGGTS